MRNFGLLLAIGLLSGCASTLVELPSWDIPQATEQAQHPLPVADRPKAASSTETTITFDEAGIRALEAGHKTSETNYNIAEANATALEAQSRAYNSLIEAGKMQNEVARIRQELLDTERRDHFFDNWFYRGIIVLGLIAVAL